MAGARGQPAAPAQSTAIPQKQLPATRWQHPSHTLLPHMSPNSEAYLQASKQVPRLGTRAPFPGVHWQE